MHRSSMVLCNPARSEDAAASETVSSKDRHASRSVLPALSANDLMEPGMHALASWRRMTDVERRRYWPRFERIRDRLFERLRNEAPALLRPPGALPGSPEFETWAGKMARLR